MSPRLAKRLASAVLVAPLALSVASFAGSATADERPTLSGTWSASALTERWNIGDWGEACGPKPSPHGASGGSVTITESGGELTFSGGGYARTNTCFEQGFAVTSHSASPRFWRTRCGTSPNDPRKATIVTTVSATDNTISFDETGEYQFILKDQNCTASVRRNRTYSLIRRLGEEPPAASASAPPPAPTPTPTPQAATIPTRETPSSSCDSPGDPARIEVRPSRRMMTPGETFQLRSVLLDAAGCRIALLPAWSSSEPKVTVSNAGLVTVDADAPEKEVEIAATVQGRSAKVVIEVVSAEKLAALLAKGEKAENEEASVAVVTTTSLGAKEATATDSSKRRKAIFLGVVGSAVVVLGVVGVFLLRRQKPETEEIEEIVPGETKMKVVKKKRLVANPKAQRPASPPAVVERTALSPGAEPPPPAPAPVAGTPMPGERGKICPVCGQRYGANAQFCGKEGAVLVLVN